MVGESQLPADNSRNRMKEKNNIESVNVVEVNRPFARVTNSTESPISHSVGM